MLSLMEGCRTAQWSWAVQGVVCVWNRGSPGSKKWCPWLPSPSAWGQKTCSLQVHGSFPSFETLKVRFLGRSCPASSTSPRDTLVSTCCSPGSGARRRPCGNGKEEPEGAEFKHRHPTLYPSTSLYSILHFSLSFS